MGELSPDTHSENLLRELAPQVLAVLARRNGDFDACEDAVQEALLEAYQTWPTRGTPDNPRAWLLTVASRRLIDVFRSESSRSSREARAWALGVPLSGSEAPEADDTLQLLFLCCHPELTSASQVALSLRAVGGLTTAQIAAVFLVPERTMAQRITRAKATIARSGRTVGDPDAKDNLPSVLSMLYLIFTEGHTSAAGKAALRPDMTSEAIRLTRQVHAVNDDPEVSGLLALMLMAHARSASRLDEHSDPIPLAKQDRTLWDRPRIEEGVSILDDALASGRPGPYQIQAAIAALHVADGPTDWRQILGLYLTLESMDRSPAVTLNRAVATAHALGPERGLEVLDGISQDPRMINHHRVAAVRGYILEMVDQTEEAAEAYELAAMGSTNEPERRYLRRRASELRSRLAP